MGVRLLRGARADTTDRARHREHRVRRRPRRRAWQRRPGRHLVVVRVGGPGPVPCDARFGGPRARQSRLPVRLDHPAGRPPPRRAGPGGGGLPALRPCPDRLGGDPANVARSGLPHLERAHDPGRHMEPALAPRVGDPDRRDPHLHLVELARPDVGLVACRDSPVVRRRSASGRRVLIAERRDVSGGRAVHDSPDRGGTGGGPGGIGPLAHDVDAERAGRLPVLGNADPRRGGRGFRAPRPPAAGPSGPRSRSP